MVSLGSGDSTTAGEIGAVSMKNGAVKEEGFIAGGWPYPHQPSGQNCDGPNCEVSLYIDLYRPYIICIKKKTNEF